MSQEKVDQKKDLKTNRKKIVRKKKVENVVSAIVVVLVGACVLAWIGYSSYTKYEAYKEANYTYTYNEVNTSGITNYTSSLSSTSTDAE